MILICLDIPSKTTTTTTTTRKKLQIFFKKYLCTILSFASSVLLDISTKTTSSKSFFL
jgi:hypothetical protein